LLSTPSNNEEQESAKEDVLLSINQSGGNGYLAFVKALWVVITGLI